MKTIMCLKDLSVKSMTCAGFAISLLTASANAFGGSGSGTFADPYQIGTAAQLQEMSEALSSHYVLTTDVDATVTTTWNGGAGFMPVGSVGTPFTGSLDGKGHTIRGLTISIDGGQNIALFGVTGTSSVVENLTMENAAVSSMDWVATLVGTNNGTIWRCHATGTVNGSGSFGGLVGTNAGLIERSSSGVTVSGGNHLGGLAGVNAGTIRDCYSTGGVSGSENPGGLAGINAGLIENCYATGNVSTGFWWIPGYARGAGGLVGSSFSQPGAAGRISNCFSTGNVSGPDAAALGGLIGVNFVAPGDPVPIIENSYYNHIAGNPAVGLGQNPAGSTVGITAIGNNMSYFFTNANPPESAWSFTSVWAFPNNITGIAFPGFKNVHQVVVNGSFEDSLAGWSATGHLEIQSGPPYVPTDGTRLVSFNSGNSTPDGMLSQAIPTIPGQAYQLDFDVGVLAYNHNDQRLEVFVAGSVPLLVDTITVTGQGGGRIVWVAKSYHFTADSATTTLTFRDLSPVTFSIDLLLDHVRVTPLVTTLLVTSIPANGVGVVVSPPDTLGAGDGGTSFRRFYNPGALVDLTAPVEAAGGTFFNWLRDGAHYSTDPDIQVTMDGDHQMTAVYWSGDPMITVQPVSIVAVEGGTAVFSVTASGAVPLSYQWRFGGTDIPGAEARELTISHVEAADAGSYDVVVSNSLGSVMSDTAVLEIWSGFVGLENGSFESDFQGWTVSGNVWIQSSYPYSPIDGIKLAAFNAGNTTPNASLSQSFTTTPGQRYFLSFDMGVLSFNTSPQKLEVEVAGSPSLLLQTFLITGIADGKCQWVTQNLAFTADSPRTTLTFRDRSFPATSSIDLLLDHVMITPRGMRTLVVESSSPWDSIPVSVSPPDDNGDADDSTRFSRKYIDGTHVDLVVPEMMTIGPFPYPFRTRTILFQHWLKDGAEIGTSPSTRIAMDGDHVLTAVYVLSPPIITAQPVGLSISVGGSAAFRVGVTEQGPTTYQWRFNGTNIREAVASAYTIPVVSWANAGTYDVVVTNAGGSTTSNVATLTVVSVSLANGSFESGFDGWSHSGNVRVQTAAMVPDGSKVLGFNTGNSSMGGVVSQTFTTIPGLTYRLTFHMGVLDYNFSEQRLEVNLSGGATLANRVFSMYGTGGGRTVWAVKTVDFTTDSAATTVKFTDCSPTSNGIDLLLDHVRLDPISFTVTTLADENDGALDRGTGDSLREAIAAATASNGVELIRFAPALDGGTITLGGTQLTVDTDVMIDASSLANPIIVSADGLSRVFEIKAGRSVSMAGLTITRGGVWLVSGCGVFNSGTLTLREMTIAGNYTGGDFATYPKGAGIYNEGILRMDSCAATGNSVGNSSGGALYNSGTAVLVNCTLSGNLAVYRGAGVLNDGTITIRHCTISDNQDYYAGGSGIHNTADLTLENSIVAGNRTSNPGVPNDLEGVVTTFLGANLIGGDPMLAPLGDYGGRTQTMPPMAGSPTIDTASWFVTTPSTDQRGLPRPRGAAPDIGAVEIFQLIVTTAVDESDAGLGVGAGDSLREVLAAAASGSGTKLISFAPALDGGTITLGGTQLTVDTDVMIDASSLTDPITISADGLSRVFEIKAGRSVSMAGLTIASGGAWLVSGCGVFNSGTLTLRDVTIADNLTVWNGVVYSRGAGVFNEGILHMDSCTATGNSAGSGGGALYNSGSAVLVNCTLSGNHSVYSGAGVLNDGTITIRHCTISNNQDIYAGGSGIHNTGELTLESSIVAGNRTANPGVPNDLEGVITTFLGANLIGGDPKLSPLGNYGGRTQTMPPMSGSPAIDSATWLGTTPSTDQRGLPRPRGAASDIGAVEIFQLIVTTTVDESDAGLGIGAGDSLREVLGAARWGPGTKLISFAPALDGGVITLNGTQLTVDAEVIIDASSLLAGITILVDRASKNFVRAFEITAGHHVSMWGLTVSGGGGFELSGGGVFNSGVLSLTNVTVAGNSVLGNLATPIRGAGIYNEGSLDMACCTVSGNSVGLGSGGGIYNRGTAFAINSTISSNEGVYTGGGVLNEGIMTIIHSTISNNMSEYLGNGGLENIGDLTVENSIIAGNSNINFPGVPSDVGGTITTSRGVNLISVDAKLAPLGNHGGRTLTMPPLPGSPAIDAAVWLDETPATDQRGVIRSGPPDIGSIEYIP